MNGTPNRAERRRLARANGWKGAKSKKGVPIAEALLAADRQRQAAERQDYANKVGTAKAAVKDMGLVLPED